MTNNALSFKHIFLGAQAERPGFRGEVVIITDKGVGVHWFGQPAQREYTWAELQDANTDVTFYDR